MTPLLQNSGGLAFFGFGLGCFGGGLVAAAVAVGLLVFRFRIEDFVVPITGALGNIASETRCIVSRKPVM